MAPTQTSDKSGLLSQSTLLLECDPRDGVRLLTLNRPQARNAINQTLSSQLCNALERAETDDRIGAIVICGSAPVFCAGVDINELRELTPTLAYEKQWLTDWPKILDAVRKPVIVGVNGAALGGGFEMVLMGDVVFASKNASFGLPEINLGTIPGAGGTVRLVERVGKGKALSMMWTGERMNANEAKEYGIVTKICENVVEESLEFAKKVADQSGICVGMIKQLVKEREKSWECRGELERMMYYLSFGTEDFKKKCDEFFRRKERKQNESSSVAVEK